VQHEAELFATNLDRLMTMRSMRNAALAQAMGVSRQIISKWRQGAITPDPTRLAVMADILGCSKDDFFSMEVVDLPPMLPISQWAKREGIPINRARSLFDLGILEGSTGGGVGEVQLVPIAIRAPSNSKRQVREMHRPGWIEAFRVNLDWRMRETKTSNTKMAKATGVGFCAVSHWRSGKGYPLLPRLPVIAQQLNCTLDDLLKPPTHQQIVNWTFRFASSWERQSEQQAA
jgi:transcriptional regulator with XRE-family HTH domain